MTYFKLFGIDKDGLAYSFSNETINWTLRALRHETQCFSLCEMYCLEGEHVRKGITYGWNPVEGYTYKPE